MLTKATLCIFVKPPLPGLVKTRLSHCLTAAQAAGLAAAFFADTFALASSCAWARVVVACDGDPSPLKLATGTEVWPQGRGDLGERMERVLSLALESSQAAMVIHAAGQPVPAPVSAGRAGERTRRLVRQRARRGASIVRARNAMKHLVLAGGGHAHVEVLRLKGVCQ